MKWQKEFISCIVDGLLFLPPLISLSTCLKIKSVRQCIQTLAAISPAALILIDIICSKHIEWRHCSLIVHHFSPHLMRMDVEERKNTQT